ncbi:MAG: ATPase [Candidatus Hydrothermarchaeota archaeon]
MYSKEEILGLIDDIRKELGMIASSTPSISRVEYNEDKDLLLIVATDRSDKAVIIGPGGWVVGRLKEMLNIGQIHVEAETDLIVRRIRIEESIGKLKEVLNSDVSKKVKFSLKNYVLPLLENADFFPDLPVNEESESHLTTIALSGGGDSSSTLAIAKMAGMNPIAITMDPGTIVLPSQLKENIEFVVKELDVPHYYLDPPHSLEEIWEKALKGHIHPCGRCHAELKKSLYEYNIREKIPLIMFGNLLPTGTQAIKVINRDLVRINLLAALSLKKGQGEELLKKIGIEIPSFGYACPLLREVHKKHPHLRRYSIQRILRKTRAGIMEPGQALKQIYSILR